MNWALSFVVGIVGAALFLAAFLWLIILPLGILWGKTVDYCSERGWL